MPKSSSERNKEYRRRLRAKARAYDYLCDKIGSVMEPTSPGMSFEDFVVVCISVTAACKEALSIGEQSNG